MKAFRFTKTSSTLPVALILCVGGILTAGPDGQQPGAARGKGAKKEWKQNAGGGADTGKQGGKHDGPRGGGLPIFEQAKSLNLTSEQQTKLTALQESLKGEMDALKQEIKAKRGQGAPDSKEDRKDMMKQFQPKLQDLGKRAREGVFAILTPEQKTELEGKLKQQWQGRDHGKGPDRAKGGEHANGAPAEKAAPPATTSNVVPSAPAQTSGTAVANPFAS
jgi:Spy/CpxP family protein refolding chaperone